MKLTLTILLSVMLSLAAQSQKMQSLEGKSTQEIRQILLTQTESTETKELIIKHNQARKTAYGFLSAAVVLGIVSNSSRNPDQDNKDSILASVGAWSCGLVAIACGISGSERFKRAKEIYLDESQGLSWNKPFIRSEIEMLRSGGY